MGGKLVQSIRSKSGPGAAVCVDSSTCTERTDAASCAVRPANELPRATAGGLPGARLRRILAYIETNLRHALSLAELSAVVHMSPFHFARLFKASTGVPPHRFVIRCRIEHAMTLMAQADSMHAIARTVGFRSTSHFTTTFRRVVGVPPCRYRRLAEHAHVGRKHSSE